MTRPQISQSGCYRGTGEDLQWSQLYIQVDNIHQWTCSSQWEKGLATLWGKENTIIVTIHSAYTISRNSKTLKQKLFWNEDESWVAQNRGPHPGTVFHVGRNWGTGLLVELQLWIPRSYLKLLVKGAMRRTIPTKFWRSLQKPLAQNLC